MTPTFVKPSGSRALTLLVFPVLMLLPIVVNTVSETNSLQMTLAASGVTTLLGLIVGAGLVLIKSLSSNLWFRLLFFLSLFALIAVYLDVLLFSYHDAIRANVDALGDYFGFIDGARPLGGLIMLGVIVLALGATVSGVVWYTGFVRMIWCNDDQVVDIFSIIFAVSTLSAIVFASSNSGPHDPLGGNEPVSETKALSITIILDAMIGSDGLRTDIPQNVELADEIDAFYRNYGFLHYPKAFSRHFYTIQSVPATLNGLSTGSPDLTKVSRTAGYHNRMTQNAFFDSLQARKLPIHVYQSQYVDVCTHEAVVSCNSLNTADRLSPHIPDEFQVQSKFFLGLYMLQYTLRNSYVTKDIIETLFRPAYAVYEKVAPDQYKLLFGFIMNVDVTFDSLFEQFAADVTAGGYGAYYGHFLPTHYPFRLDAQCKPLMKRFGITGEKAFSRLVETHGNSPDQAQRKREAFYISYRDHVRCTHLKLSALFDGLKRQGRFEDAEITLFGDHGSRISNGFSKDGVSTLDLIDNHSTLFALKEPAGRAQRDPRIISVQQLLMAHQDANPAGQLREIERTLVLRNKGGENTFLVKMPDF